MKNIILISTFTFLCSCTLLSTVSGQKEEEYKNRGEHIVEMGYAASRAKPKLTNVSVDEGYYVPQSVGNKHLPDWYIKSVEFELQSTSLTEVLLAIQKLHRVVSQLPKLEETDKTEKKFPFYFKGRLGDALQQLSLLSGFAYEVDGNIVKWSVLKTYYFRVALPPTVNSFRIGQRDSKDQQSNNSQRFAAYGENTEVSQLIQNDSFVEAMPGTDGNLDGWSSMGSALSKMIGETKGSFVSYDKSSGVVMVRAYPSVVKEIKKYVRELEKAAFTQVVFDFQFIEYTNTDGAKGAYNLDLVKNNFKIGSSASSLSLGGDLKAGLLSDFNPVSLGANVLSGNWAGSKVIVDALNKTGTTASLGEPTLISSHNKGAQLILGDDVSFASSSSGGINQSGAVSSLKASVLSLGTEITVLPTVMDSDDMVFVQIDIKMHNLKVLNSFESGNARIQTPRTGKHESRISFSAKSGQAILLASNSLLKSDYQSEDSGVLSALFGAARSSSEEKKELLILVTPRIIRPNLR